MHEEKNPIRTYEKFRQDRIIVSQDTYERIFRRHRNLYEIIISFEKGEDCLKNTLAIIL